MLFDITRIAKWAMYACLLGWGISAWMITRLPPRDVIRDMLLKEPVQTNIEEKPPFAITYYGRKHQAVTIAEYEIWGLVVSQRDPARWYTFDMEHDKYSLSPKDLCLIWGDNLKTDDYRKVSVRNDVFTCLYDYPETVRFNPVQLSNNHLVVDKLNLRDIVDDINIGDQVHIKGKLINYSEDRWGSRWRNTSITRGDIGQIASEAIYVDTLEILSTYNDTWDKLRQAFMVSTILLLCFRVGAFLHLLKPGTSHLIPFRNS